LISASPKFTVVALRSEISKLPKFWRVWWSKEPLKANSILMSVRESEPKNLEIKKHKESK
jgi:hypothetical protein